MYFKRKYRQTDFRLRLAFDVIPLDPLSSDISLPLLAWNFARVCFNSIHSANTVRECSNFLTLAVHLLSVDGSSKPFQSTRFRYSCIWIWVVRWSPYALGTRTRTLCSPFDVADNLNGTNNSVIFANCNDNSVIFANCMIICNFRDVHLNSYLFVFFVKIGTYSIETCQK